MVTLEYKKQLDNLDPKESLNKLVSLIVTNGFTIIKKRELAGLIIASKETDLGKLDLTVSAGIISRDSVSFVLRGEDREHVKESLLALARSPLT